MKKFIQDFKDFAFKGNILDMAIGVIIGGAFGKIVTSLVENIISPFITLLTGAAQLSEFTIKLKDAVMNGEEVVTEAVVLNIGAFLQSIIDFLIIALCIFLILRAIMAAKTKFEALKKTEEAAEEGAEPEDTELSVLQEIKALLEKQNK